MKLAEHYLNETRREVSAFSPTYLLLAWHSEEQQCNQQREQMSGLEASGFRFVPIGRGHPASVVVEGH